MSLPSINTNKNRLAELTARLFNKLGVFHGLCIWALSLVGVTGTPAVSYSILLYFVVWMPPTVLGVLVLWRSGKALELLRVARGEDDSSSNWRG